MLRLACVCGTNCGPTLVTAHGCFGRVRGFTAVAVISLALGIGANTAIFSLANEVLYKTISVPDADRLRLLNWVKLKNTKVGTAWGSFGRNLAGQTTGSPFPYPLYLDLRNRQTVMENMVAFKDMSQLTATVDGQAESIEGQFVSGNYYHALRVSTIAGRPIAESDDPSPSQPVAVISDSYWSRRFGRSAEVIGKSIRVNTLPVTIIGVNSPQFQGAKIGHKPDIFLPITFLPSLDPRESKLSVTADPDFWWVLILGRLKPGISQEAAQRAAETEFRSSLRATLPQKPLNEYPGLLLDTGARGFDTETAAYTRPLRLLFIAAGLVLLIACVNVANLLLARGSGRQREIGMRLAMGASRFRIFRQALTESMLLAVFGGLTGLALGYAGRSLLPAMFDHSGRIEGHFDWKVFAFAVGGTLLTGFLFGVAPALRLDSGRVGNVLKETDRMSLGGSRALFGKSLVVLQVGLSVVLLVSAGLFVRTLANLKSVPIGFNTQRLLLFDLDPPSARYSGMRHTLLFQQIEEKIAALPSVQSVTLSSEPLLANTMENLCVRPTGRAPGKENEDYPWSNKVGSRFFETVEMPIVMGRGFNWHDNKSAPLVAVINRKLAARFFPNVNPIGQTLNACDVNTMGPPIEVVGVAADARYASLDAAPPPTIYFPYLQQDAGYGFTFEVKSAASTESILKLIRTAVASIDRDLPLLDVRTQGQQVDETLSQPRLFASLTTGFGMLALLLAGIGIYGIVAYNVERRTNEIGIRMALGAQARSVLTMILREAWLLAVLGIALGIMVSFMATRLIQSELFGIGSNDPLAYSVAGVLLLLIALIAGLMPARRAANIDPCEALRHE